MSINYFLRIILPFIIGLLMLAYIVTRALSLPMTIDEAHTCIRYVPLPIKDIVTYADPLPNNHILNTLFIKLSVAIFGMHPWSARLPNILGFILYFSMIFLITRKITSEPIITLLGIVVMTCNPYVIDFFSLARGYGLCISFIAASSYFAYCFLERKSNRDLTWSLVLAIASVYSNFAAMNFFIALVTLMAIFALQEKFKSEKPLTAFLQYVWKPIVIIISSGVLLVIITYLPIKKIVMTYQFAYWGTEGFYEDTLIPWVTASVYRMNYFRIPGTAFSNLLIALVAILLLTAIIMWKRDHWQIGRHPQVFFMLLFVVTLAVNIFQFHLIHIPELGGRAALFLYPLLTINIILFASYLYDKRRASCYFFSLPLIVLCALHMGRSINFRSCYEWWFDQNTYTVLNYLKEEHQKNPKSAITLDTWWLFFASLDFYIVNDPEDWVTLKPFHMDLNPDSAFEYYYIFENEKSQLDSEYVSVLFFPDSQYLMKRKDFSLRQFPAGKK